MIKSKVLFILHIPPPVNGAALMGQYLKESPLINTNFETDYINLTAAFNLDQIGKRSFAKFWIVLQILKNVLAAIRTKKYDLCYMTLTAKGAGFYKDFLVVLLLKLFRLKIIYHFHNKGVAKSGKKWYNHLLYQITFHKAECILLAPTLFNDVRPYIARSKVYFCANGIPHIAVTDKPLLVNAATMSVCKFLFLSNMMKEKGVLDLLEACKLIKNKKLKFECHFIGAWSDITEQAFNHAVSTLELKNEVKMHGKKYNEDKIEFFNLADVFVFPTYYHNECFPLVLLEAMQFGLPVIATPEGAIAEIVLDKKTGLLIKQKDVNALAAAMIAVLNNPIERKKMGDEGRKRYEELFTLGSFEEKMYSILNTSIQN